MHDLAPMHGSPQTLQRLRAVLKLAQKHDSDGFFFDQMKSFVNNYQDLLTRHWQPTIKRMLAYSDESFFVLMDLAYKADLPLQVTILSQILQTIRLEARIAAIDHALQPQKG